MDIIGLSASGEDEYEKKDVYVYKFIKYTTYIHIYRKLYINIK